MGNFILGFAIGQILVILILFMVSVVDGDY